MVNVTRDAPLVPAMDRPVQAFRALLEKMQATLMGGRRERGRDRRRVAAAIALALEFTTWHSMTREAGLRNGEAITLMAATVAGARNFRQTSG